MRNLACQNAGRNLTREEWQEMFGTLEYRATCPLFMAGRVWETGEGRESIARQEGKG
ncbi:MAG: hypothetical protein ACRCYY_19965 [Trueperaceae bacterium]